MSRRNLVDTHKDRVIKSTKNKAYWSTIGESGYESVRANPDSLPEAHNSPSEVELLMGEAIAHLVGRQREVYLLAYREGKSNTEVGEILGISRDTVQVYKERAVKFLTGYCRKIMENKSDD